jgi:NAD(P)-dependent dehydrogenase (short-subunit alcohol dehydrogenase family)
MSKRVCLITGASRGIGAAAARLAGQRGYTVALNYRESGDAAEAVAEAIRRDGGTALTLRADVVAEPEVVTLFERIDAELGRLDALVNNAGILFPQMRVEDMDAERLRRTLDVNVVGAFLCAREAVRRMSTRHGGAGGTIVNVSSRASQLGSPGEYVDYAASKGAVDTLTIGLAREVAAEGIRVAAVRPGIIDTGIHASGGDPGRVARLAGSIPMGRGGTPEEVAEAILWLLSDEASYATGSVIDVAGGR